MKQSSFPCYGQPQRILWQNWPKIKIALYWVSSRSQGRFLTIHGQLFAGFPLLLASSVMEKETRQLSLGILTEVPFDEKQHVTRLHV